MDLLLSVVLAALLGVVIFFVHFVFRVIPTLKQSRSFTNTHEGRFVDPNSPASIETIGTPISQNRTKDQSSSSPIPQGDLLSLPAVVNVSVVVPAYNEEPRIEQMLNETIEYLERRGKKFEIVVVNDGSKDKTGEKVLGYSRKYGFDKVRLLNLAFNCGKGAAINKGIRHCRGEYILFADADGATQFDGLKNLETKLAEISRDGLGCVCGSRYIDNKKNSAERTALRKFVSLGFHTLVSIVCGANIKDTQCGFKLFTRKAAQLIFPSQHVDRWAFDIEVLYLCSVFRVPVSEVQVTWNEVAGSKMTIAGAIGMFRDIVLIRILYMFGVWHLKSTKTQ